VIRKPLSDALEGEIQRLELLICRAWCMLAVAGIVGGVASWAVTSLEMALWCSAAATAYMMWFGFEAYRRGKGDVGRALVTAGAIVEGSLPWVFLILLSRVQGAVYALSSWVPPLLFAALVVAATARLRPARPLFIAVSSALVFPTVYFGVVRGQLSPAALAEPLYGATMQVIRTGSLIVGGVMGMLVANGLRQAIGRADSTVRERDLFGKYRLGKRIASGGMGTVYEAVYCPEGGFERNVAVKHIHPHLAREERFVEAFRREAELSARLAHPNIVQVLDFGRIDERYFLALEHVDGITVARLLQSGRHVEAGLVAFIAREVLAGLAYSHAGARDARGQLLRVVHRDLSPSNILVSRSGDVKIADFGVARALKDAASAATKNVVGNVGYMAPEQARALPIDERSDLFSLGVILWELLTGRRLFDRGSEAPTLLALVSQPIAPPSTIRPVDSGWDRLLACALARDPDKRFASAESMAQALVGLPDLQTGRDLAAELGAMVRAIGDGDDDPVAVTTPIVRRLP
jgi:eukaryotic-like serine/threonine-protein kinase